jgi:hypothetical protein
LVTVRGDEIADKPAREGTSRQFDGKKTGLGGLWAEYKKKDKMLDG